MKRLLVALLLGIALCLCACGAKEQTLPPAQTVTPSLPPMESPLPTSAAVTPELAPKSVEIIPGDSELVRVQDYLPGIRVDLRYAGTENFTGAAIYDFSEAWLRYGTVKKLQAAQESLREQGYGLLIWDAYRPQTAQFRLWEAVPDPVFVANPYTGHSSHSNGGTVDITLVTLAGEPAEMPSGFDEFSALADRDYSDVSQAAGEHAQILERAMTAAGFAPYAGEWWHFADSDGYSHEDVAGFTLPSDGDALYTPNCEEYISLRAAPDYDAPVLECIPLGESFPVLGLMGDFARVSCRGIQGYVALAYIRQESR